MTSGGGISRCSIGVAGSGLFVSRTVSVGFGEADLTVDTWFSVSGSLNIVSDSPRPAGSASNSKSPILSITTLALVTQSPAERTQLVAAATICFPASGATTSSTSVSAFTNMSLVACTRSVKRVYMVSRASSSCSDLRESRSHTSSTTLSSWRHATTECWVIWASSSEDRDWRCSPMKEPM